MSQSIPTTQDLADDIVAQVDGETGQTTPLLAKAFTRVLGKALSGPLVLLYKYGGYVALQAYATTASYRETTFLGVKLRPLVELGRRNGTGDPLPATRAEIVFTYTVQSISPIPLAAGAQIVNSATGVVYTVPAPLDVSTLGAKSATARAASDPQNGNGAGSIGNVVVGTELQFANPLPYVARVVKVTAQSVQGADEEKESAYRARVIRRGQQKPQGGASADYAQWSEEVAGIVEAFPYRGAPGEIDVYVEATPDSSGSADGIPTNAQRTAVLDSIERNAAGKATRRPTNARVNVLPITRTPFDVRVVGLTIESSLDAAARAAIDDAIDEHLRSRKPFITGLSVLPRADRVTLAAISGIVDNVASSLGGSVATVMLESGGDQITAYTLGFGEKAKLGATTFV